MQIRIYALGAGFICLRARRTDAHPISDLVIADVRLISNLAAQPQLGILSKRWPGIDPTNCSNSSVAQPRVLVA